jgi:hypothetical protein
MVVSEMLLGLKGREKTIYKHWLTCLEPIDDQGRLLRHLRRGAAGPLLRRFDC